MHFRIPTPRDVKFSGSCGRRQRQNRYTNESLGEPADFIPTQCWCFNPPYQTPIHFFTTTVPMDKIRTEPKDWGLCFPNETTATRCPSPKGATSLRLAIQQACLLFQVGPAKWFSPWLTLKRTQRGYHQHKDNPRRTP